MPITGSCLCGNVKITVNDGGLPLKPVVCRCTNCQQTAGSVFSLVALLPKEHVEISGETTAYRDDTTSSGNHSFRRFCPTCGSPVQTVSPSRDTLAIIKMGLFAKSSAWGKEIQPPQSQIFTRNKKDWEPLVEGSAVVDGAP
ncbi:Glutathione-dependent formaldehyde-activating enzyme/centromere protein V [Kalmanozyma brasiliensis GHG001]|uniref:CENP-V/GFA domain-containing protein n=1 Tax=Kalmanozyma brasiliensis (strain GHG001) TaxID=1365824 RepID=V5GPN1_KALBG|nr:Glutathione-dependent formaldehyde-activating enzyme/centromere protein V [Kalmanozyma brasiliensis GHG001]EST07917.1 Glutathione-dependent formaldehyde-activating enzyme/centromere protein V [Kalmanozyma brasiliensis GHG001]